MKGMIHALEAVIAGIILLSFALILPQTVQNDSKLSPIELSDSEISGNSPEILREIFYRYYPLYDSTFSLTTFTFLHGDFEGNLTINLSGETYSFGELIVWLNKTQETKIFLNENLVLEMGDRTGLSRHNFENTGETIFKIKGNSLSGQYFISLKNVSKELPIAQRYLSYFYYGDSFMPVALEVALNE